MQIAIVEVQNVVAPAIVPNVVVVSAIVQVPNVVAPPFLQLVLHHWHFLLNLLKRKSFASVSYTVSVGWIPQPRNPKMKTNLEK
jgi:hypothetical protein